MNREATLIVTLVDDLIVEILLRLPVKSILRFKCVCKSWYSIISHPQFAETHFDVGATPTHRLLQICDDQGVDSIDINASLHADPTKIRLNIPYPTCKVSIAGSCRGFILLKTNLFSFIIWNPSTGLKKQIGLPRNNDSVVWLYGIGYDSSADDYVVVAITSVSVNFFSVRTNKWNVSEDTVPHCYPEFSFLKGSLLNETLHWCVKSHDHRVIVAFDIREKRLLNIPLPCHIFVVPNIYPLYPLMVMGGCLCFFLLNNETKVIETWTMKKYKMQSSWTKSFVLPFPIRPFIPICLRKNGEILAMTGKRSFARFNDRGEVLEILTRERYAANLGFANHCVYRESLLSLPSSEEEEY